MIFLKKIYKHLLTIKSKFLNLPFFIFNFNILSKNLGYGILMWFSNKNFIQFNFLPKRFKDYNILKEKYQNFPSTGMVIQGAIVDVNFLFETLKIYKKIFPNIRIVLSTWDYEKIKINNKMETLVHKIIYNSSKNLNPGPQNTNLQLITTYNGLKYLQKKVKFVLKTRTDHRVYSANTFNLLHNLLKIFSKSKNKSEILACSAFSLKNIPYFITDHLLFGKTKNLMRYFHKDPIDESIDKIFKIKNKHKYLINNTWCISEVFYCSRYLAYKNHKLKWNLKDWSDVLRKYFIIFDHEMIDLLFYSKKHFYFHYQHYLKSYNQTSHPVLNFSTWINLRNNKDYYFNERDRILVK